MRKGRSISASLNCPSQFVTDAPQLRKVLTCQQSQLQTGTFELSASYKLSLAFFTIISISFLWLSPTYAQQEQDPLSLNDSLTNISYGIVRFDNTASSISSINLADSLTHIYTSPDQALQGMAAGVFATQASGQPAAVLQRLDLTSGN